MKVINIVLIYTLRLEVNSAYKIYFPTYQAYFYFMTHASFCTCSKLPKCLEYIKS